MLSVSLPEVLVMSVRNHLGGEGHPHFLDDFCHGPSHGQFLHSRLGACGLETLGSRKEDKNHRDTG